MDKFTHDLLYGVPDEADYAESSTELDPDGVPESRVEAIKLLLNSEDREVSFVSALVLTSWGYKEGLNRLEDILKNNSQIAMPHRLYSYDESLLHSLLALKSYWAVQTDNGNKVFAREDVFPLIKKIILRSNEERFDISIIFPWIEREKYDEYIPFIKEHLEKIIDDKGYHGWKICDVILFLNKTCPKYIQNLLKKKGKSIDYYCS